MESQLYSLARRLGEQLDTRNMTLATAESCTGGWVAKVVTDIAGSSRWFDRGFVTYSNEAKEEMLGVGSAVLERHGAVSEAVVTAMVQGALRNSRASVALAISGIAGPGGGTSEKPVGTVCIAWGVREAEVIARRCHFDGDREAIRRRAVGEALQGVLDLIG